MPARFLPVLAALVLSGCGRRAASARTKSGEGALRDASRAIAPASTFCNPLDLDYRFALDTPSRRDVADPVIALVNDEYYLFAAQSGGYWHSHDLREWQFVVPTGMPVTNDSPRILVLDGRVYYASIGATVPYTSDDPASGVWRAATATEAIRALDASRRWEQSTPSVYDGKGFGGRTGAGMTFQDRRGAYWRVATIHLSAAERQERRLGIFPAFGDRAGAERTDMYPDDYPQLLPGSSPAIVDHNATGWTLLSVGRKATASSSLADHAPELAFDEVARTWWSATSGGVGEWLSVDLGSIARVAALQINFAEQGTHAFGRDEDSYQQYVVESSIDGVHWTTRIDESSATRDAPHRYVQFDTTRNARFVRIINVHAAAGGSFAIRDLRIFGRSPVAAPGQVDAIGEVGVSRGTNPLVARASR